MEKNVLQTDLSGKVAVVTGAGGVLCSYLAKVLARAGAKVALVNRSDAAINQYAAEIIAEGGVAKGVYFFCCVSRKNTAISGEKNLFAGAANYINRFRRDLRLTKIPAQGSGVCA